MTEAPSTPRHAATLVLTRRMEDGPRVLMGQRGKGASFMPSKFVFPGGALDPADRMLAEHFDVAPEEADRLRLKSEEGIEPAALALAALRETWEETGLAIGAPDDALVLAADTTVSAGRRILGKPADAGEAAEFLLLLSGRRHRVTTAIALRHGDRLWTRSVETSVKVKRLSDVEINAYLATGDWQGKAGAYAIQGPAGAFIPWISGSFTGIVGLPLSETAVLLQGIGYPLYREAS